MPQVLYCITIIHCLLQVIVPSGIKVLLERNYWGIDVTVYAPKPKSTKNEEGLCTYDANYDIGRLMDATFGENQR